MNGRLYALFVEPPDRFLTKKESLHIETCERLCREFGGEFLRLKSNSVLEGITATAREYRITQIVVGETHRSRWELLFKGGSVVQRLVRSLPTIDLHVIATDRNGE